MSTSAEQVDQPFAVSVNVTDDVLIVELRDGRTVSVPLSWYPRLEYATERERDAWELIGGGAGIHWEVVDEDISVEALVAGKPSNESQASLKRWLSDRGCVTSVGVNSSRQAGGSLREVLQVIEPAGLARQKGHLYTRGTVIEWERPHDSA